MEPITIRLAGVTFGNCQENIHLHGGPAITVYDVTREPDNVFDPNAISVDIGPFKFGYLPKHLAQRLAPSMDGGQKFRAELVSINRSPFHDQVGMTVKIAKIN